MIDFSPNIEEEERKANVNDTTDYSEKSNEIFNSLNEYEKHNPNYILSKIDSIFNMRLESNNPNLYEEELKMYGDILNYQSQNLRLESITRELEIINEAISMMMYGKLVTNEEAEEEDNKIFKEMKDSNKANMTNLYYLSKLLALTNSYIDNTERHIEIISSINSTIHQHTLKERYSLITKEDADCIQYQSRNDLSEQLDTINFLSDKLIIKNYLCEIYNKIVSYSVARNAFKKTNTNIDTKYDTLANKEKELKKSFEDAVKVMEYSQCQNDVYTDILYERSELIKSFYEYEK